MKLFVVRERTRVSEGLHDFITRRLHFVLGRFAPEVERVTAGRGCEWPARRNGQSLPHGS